MSFGEAMRSLSEGTVRSLSEGTVRSLSEGTVRSLLGTKTSTKVLVDQIAICE